MKKRNEIKFNWLNEWYYTSKLMDGWNEMIPFINSINQLNLNLTHEWSEAMPQRMNALN